MSAPVKQPLQLCAAEAVIANPSGDISAVALGASLPTSGPVNCSYVLGTTLLPHCRAEVRISMTVQNPFFHSLQVLDRATGRLLWDAASVTGEILPIPPPIRAPTAQGLVVRFATSFANTGARAWRGGRGVLPAASLARVPAPRSPDAARSELLLSLARGVAAAGHGRSLSLPLSLAAPAGETYKTGFAGSHAGVCTNPDGSEYSTDTYPLDFTNVTFRGNVAKAASGGAVAAAVAAGSYDGRRAVALRARGLGAFGNTAAAAAGAIFLDGLSSIDAEGLDVRGNRAAGAAAPGGAWAPSSGGGVAATAAASVSVRQSLIADNVAAAGPGGGLSVRGLFNRPAPFEAVDTVLQGNVANAVRTQQPVETEAVCLILRGGRLRSPPLLRLRTASRTQNGGGAVLSALSSVRFVNTTFSANVAYGA